MYSEIAANKRRTVVLIILFIILIAGFGWLLAQIQSNTMFLVAMLAFGIGYSFISYYNSDKIALALSGAKPVTKKQAPRLYRIIENLCITAGLPMPRVYVIDDPSPNAFATGRNPEHAAVAATTGLLDMMNDQELEGVLAHELSHVGNYDIRVMGIVLMLVTILVYLSDFIFRMAFWGGIGDDNGGRNPLVLLLGLAAALIAPLLGILLQLAVSRKREYLADASGALLTRYPEGLASALEKIQEYPKGMKRASNATAHLYIESPLRGRSARGFFASLFSTHPPTEERIARLKAMGGKL